MVAIPCDVAGAPFVLVALMGTAVQCPPMQPIEAHGRRTQIHYTDMPILLSFTSKSQCACSSALPDFPDVPAEGYLKKLLPP